MKQSDLVLLGALVGAVAAIQAIGCDGDSSTGTTNGQAGSSAASSAATGTGGGTSSSSGSSSSSSSGAGGQGGQGGTGGMHPPSISEGESLYEAEAHLAADNMGGIVVAWIGFMGGGSPRTIGYTASRDGGLTWDAPTHIDSPDLRHSSNPAVAVDSQGNFWLAWLGFRFDINNKDEHIYLSKLDNATNTFGTPAIASDDGTNTNLDFDKPWVTTDASGAVLVTWSDFTGPLELKLAKTTDGTTFTRSTIVNDATAGNLAFPCLDRSQGPTAPLYVVHLGAGGALTLRKSDDGGVTWTPKNVPVMGAVFETPNCVTRGTDVWISYAYGTTLFSPTESVPGDEVRIVHSANGGDTFDPPVTISSGTAGMKYLFPQLVLTGAGALAAVYYSGTPGMPQTVVQSSSMDGVTWTSSDAASAGLFTVSRVTPDWPGDYMGLAASNSAVYTAFGDNTGGQTHIQFRHLQGL